MGVVEKSEIIDGARVRPGDVLIALASSGPHSNGYSLIRKVIETCAARLDAPFDDSTLGATLLAPTRIYVKSVLALLRALPVHAIAHITGGGLPGKLPRVLPAGTRAVLDRRAWTWPAIFAWLQENGDIETREMYRTFNCGVGMVLAVDANDAERALTLLRAHGETAFPVGQVEAYTGDERVVIA